jgi:DNA-directed RNA polymerase subunit beta'
MKDLKNDRRKMASGREEQYLNPIYLMAHSGARGGVEQIRQLAGMRGLMAKPSGEIIETPIKANFREGLTVLEYFSSTHGARKGLADTALKTADSGYLTRKLADVAQNVVVTTHDCGSPHGINKSAVYQGEEIAKPLSESIRGRVSRADIVHPKEDVVLVKENELITWDIARRIESLGIDKIQVRSPMTCQASLGICRLCYGMDLSTGALVEEGMAVGIIAAQSIGEPGTQLTMRTFHIGGVARRSVIENEIKAKKQGSVKLERVKLVENEKGEKVVLSRNGQLQILDPRGRELDKYMIQYGAVLHVTDGQAVTPGVLLVKWDPHHTPFLAEVGGRVRFEDIIPGETLRQERSPGGTEQLTIMEHKGNYHPQIIVTDEQDKILDVYYIPERAVLEVRPGQDVKAGTLLAKILREVGGTQDITGGLPRVTEIFEARRPKEPAVIAEKAGRVELISERTRGKRKILVHPVDDQGRATGEPAMEHLVPHGKHLRVHGGDYVNEGDPLVDGPLVPHDILRISGVEAVQQYLLREIQNVYRTQRVDIDDKHVEIIIAQMLRKVKIETVGDTKLLPGAVIDKFLFKEVNDRLRQCCKVKDPGDSDFKEHEIVDREVFEQERARLEAEGKTPPTFIEPKLSKCSEQLLGITKAAVQSDSFISAASFQETTKVLTEAALAGKEDELVGLKENVILGHLIPAGTGFKVHQEAEVRLNPEALEALGIRQADAVPHRHRPQPSAEMAQVE